MYDVRSGACVMASDDGFEGALRMFTTRVVDEVVQVSLEEPTNDE
jgi:hypothetical protein